MYIFIWCISLAHTYIYRMVRSIKMSRNRLVNIIVPFGIIGIWIYMYICRNWYNGIYLGIGIITP